VLEAAWATGSSGVLIAVPPPEELEGADELTRQAVAGGEAMMGAEVTPRLLARLSALSGGRSVDVNVKLVVNNARVAAEVARAYAGRVNNEE
jgi:pseudouridine-5'-phosphate glycosidase